MGKGEQTRTAILDEALKIASRLGLEGLTIGSLADATGMSKSGLFAHFGSREDLQLAVLEHFAQLYGERVFVPVLKIERGLPRLQALFERWLDWTIASGLPGGCIMISAANEYDDRPGPIRDAVIANQHRGNAITQKAVRLAVEEGHLRSDTDPEQIAFEMLGIMLASQTTSAAPAPQQSIRSNGSSGARRSCSPPMVHHGPPRDPHHRGRSAG